MRVTTTMAAVLLAVLLFTTAAQAQQIKKSTVSGQLLSASASVPANSSVTVFTTPASGFFILTQACSFNAPIQIRGSIFGPIPTSTSGCTKYEPGIALPQEEIITCSVSITLPPPPAQPPPLTCLITGVLQEEESPGPPHKQDE